MLVALYLRRSTNDFLQADSLNRQEEYLREAAARLGHTVSEVFSDSASGRRVTGRDEFQRLLNIVKDGAPFKAIMVLDVSRWGRFENVDEAAYYEFYCLIHGVAVIYANEPFDNANPAPLVALLKSIKRVQAAELSNEKSRTVTAAQARVAQQGFLHGGNAPLGMKRVLVTLNGEYVSDLEDGQYKLVSNYRVKLAPSNDARAVRTVRRIFKQYVDDELPLQEIADRLNRARITGAQGGRWSAGGVLHILRNERYAGTMTYRIHIQGQKHTQIDDYRDDPDAAGRFCRAVNAHAGIVSPEQWERAQVRLAARTQRKTNYQLAADLRRSLESWGAVLPDSIDASKSLASWETYRNRFQNGYEEALDLAAADEIAEARRRIKTRIEEHLTVEEQGQIWIVDGHLKVGIRIGWPRRRRNAIAWRFSLHDAAQHDVTLGLAFAATPTLAHVATILFHTSRILPNRRTVFINIRPKHDKNRVRVDGDAPLTPIIHSLQHGYAVPEERKQKALLAVLQAQPLANLAAAGRELGWSSEVCHRVYRRLLAAGHMLPPLQRSPGRRLFVVCPRCGNKRSMPPSEAFKLLTHVCIQCLRRSGYRVEPSEHV